MSKESNITAICLILCFSNTILSIESAKILAVFPYPGPSQYILVQPYLKELALRGHEVTVINAFPQKEKLKNFRDIAVLEVHEHYEEILSDIIVSHNKWDELNFLEIFYLNITLKVLKNESVRNLMQSNEKFDLVIVEVLMTDAVYGLGQHFNAPMIGISTFGTDLTIDELVGNVSPPSYIPLVTSGLTEHMDFCDRFKNFLLITLDWLHLHVVHLPQQEKIYKKYFPNAKMPLADVRKSFSLVFLNQHFSFSFARPLVPNMIEVGGLHINHKPAPLPTDMEAFISGARHGVIYFSMGSNIKSKDFPKEKIEVLLKTFSSLAQRVLWKFEAADLPGKPDNVFISKWFPQPDILAHPNVKLFITHGGMLSTIEAIYHGKPVIGMPFFYDQFLNVKRAKQAGYGLDVDIKTLNVAELKEKIELILKDDSFRTVVAKLSQRYHDQPRSPLESAVYWTEYVLRHDGSPHMRVTGLNLSFLQYHNIDVISAIVCAMILLLLSFSILINNLFKLLTMGRKDKIKQN